MDTMPSPFPAYLLSITQNGLQGDPSYSSQKSPTVAFPSEVPIAQSRAQCLQEYSFNSIPVGVALGSGGVECPVLIGTRVIMFPKRTPE